MSDLTITSGGIAVESNSAGSSISTGRRKIIRVSPTCSTDALSQGKVIFQSTEIPNAVKEEGGCSKLLGMHIVDYDNEGHDMNIYLNQKQQNIGPLGSTSDCEDADWKASKPINAFLLDWTDGVVFSGGSKFRGYSHFGISHSDDSVSLPCILQAEPGSTSVYFQAEARESVTYTAAALEFVFHIEY